MPRKPAAKFKCEKCGKSFGMAMHLGRHMTTIHGRTPTAAKAAKPKKTKKVGTRKRGRVGPPTGVAGRLGLRDLSIDQLVEVIAAAREEGQRRIAEMKQVLLATPLPRVGRPQRPKAAAKPKAPAKAQRRARRKFKITGPESILAFVKNAGKQSVTTAEIVKHWKSEKRAGDGYNALGELVKAKKLKKEKIKGAKGSRYTAA
jgi:hypothetical protein